MFAICFLLEIPMRGCPFQMKSLETIFVPCLTIIMHLSCNLVLTGDPLMGISNRKHIAKLSSDISILCFLGTDARGEYHYHCNYYPIMCSTIIIMIIISSEIIIIVISTTVTLLQYDYSHHFISMAHRTRAPRRGPGSPCAST